MSRFLCSSLDWNMFQHKLSISHHDFSVPIIGHNDNSKFFGVGTFYYELLISYPSRHMTRQVFEQDVMAFIRRIFHDTFSITSSRWRSSTNKSVPKWTQVVYWAARHVPVFIHTCQFIDHFRRISAAGEQIIYRTTYIYRICFKSSRNHMTFCLKC